MRIAKIDRPVAVWKTHALFLLLALGAISPARPAAANPPQPAAGALQITSETFTSVRQDGQNLIVSFTDTGVMTGSFDGTFTATGTGVFHGPDPATAPNESHGTIIFTGTVAGCPGVRTVVFNTRGSGVGPVGTGIIVSTGQGNPGVAAHLTYSQVGLTAEYTGQYQCH